MRSRRFLGALALVMLGCSSGETPASQVQDDASGTPDVSDVGRSPREAGDDCPGAWECPCCGTYLRICNKDHSNPHQCEERCAEVCDAGAIDAASDVATDAASDVATDAASDVAADGSDAD